MDRIAVIRTGPPDKLRYLKDAAAQYRALVRATYGFPSLTKAVSNLSKAVIGNSGSFVDLWSSVPYEIRQMILRKQTFVYADRIQSFWIVNYDTALKSFQYMPLDQGRNQNPSEFLAEWKRTFVSEGYRTTDFDDLVEYATTEDPSALGLLKQYRQSAEAVRQLIRWAIGFERTMKALIAEHDRNSNRYYNGGPANDPRNMPTSGKIEVLYHATTQAKQILSQGFKTREQLGDQQAALGGGPSDLVSFTASLEEARQIASRLREIIQIANGKITLEQVIRRAKKYGVDLTTDTDYKAYLYYHNNQNSPNPWVRRQIERMTPVSSADMAVSLYRKFLALGPKYDPVFFGVTANNFKGLRPEDVGVVAAEVDMTQVSEYLEAMYEYRVPVGAIRRIVRIMK